MTQPDPLANITYQTSYQPPKRPGRTHTITSTATASRPITSTAQATAAEPEAEAAMGRPRGILTPKGMKGKQHTVMFAGKLRSCTVLHDAVNLLMLQSRF